MVDQPDFDAADVANSILGLDTDPAPPSPPAAVPSPAAPSPQVPPARHGALGWVLLVALVFAVSIAISMAVQLGPSQPSDQVTPPECGGLYSSCCDDWNERDRDRYERDSRGGLFDEEANFADAPPTSGC